MFCGQQTDQLKNNNTREWEKERHTRLKKESGEGKGRVGIQGNVHYRESVTTDYSSLHRRGLRGVEPDMTYLLDLTYSRAPTPLV